MLFWLLAADARTPPSSAAISLHVMQPLVERGEPLNGIVTVSGGPSNDPPFEVRVELEDATGRIVDRVDIRSNQGRAADAFEILFELNTTWALTMVGKLHARGKFIDGSSPLHAPPANISIIPYPLDYDDYWVNVWGGGSADSPGYFAALEKASVNLGHMYRDYDYDGVAYADGTSFGSYHGALHNLRPNHDFLEDKLWFEMAETHPLPETLKSIYGEFLKNGTYGTPAARSNFIRPVSLSSASSLDELEDNIRPRMERSRRFRPSQWNIADEYGWFHRANPFDFDIGPASMFAFNRWLQELYPTIGALNTAWCDFLSTFC